MPTMTRCPGCKNQLRVPDNLYGRNVKCPTCGTQFVALSEEEMQAQHESAAASEPEYYEEEEQEEYEEAPRRPRRRRRRDYEPHRGAVILVLGLLGLLLCAPLGIAAWVMGNSDLEKIQRGVMDPEGKGLTQAGRILGIVSTILLIIWCICGLLYGILLAIAGAGGFK